MVYPTSQNTTESRTSRKSIKTWMIFILFCLNLTYTDYTFLDIDILSKFIILAPLPSKFKKSPKSHLYFWQIVLPTYLKLFSSEKCISLWSKNRFLIFTITRKWCWIACLMLDIILHWMIFASYVNKLFNHPNNYK